MTEALGTIRVRPAGGKVVVSLAADGGPVSASLTTEQAVTTAKAIIESAAAIRADAEAAEMKARSKAKAKAAKLDGVQP